MPRAVRQRAMLAALFVLSSRARADIRAGASVDAAEIGTEDQLVYTVTVESDEGSISGITVEPPDFKGFDYQGPSTSTQQSFSFVNGRQSVSLTRTYRWSLTPSAAGTYDLAPARISTGGKTYSTNGVKVQVVEGRVKPRAQPRSPFSLFPFGADPFEEDPFFRDPLSRFRRGPPRKNEVDVRAELEKPRVFVGQPVTLTYRLFIRGGWQIASVGLKEPLRISGFREEEVKLPDRRPSSAGELDGQQAAVYVAKQDILFPITPGRVTIPESIWQIGVTTGFGMDTIERVVPAIALEVEPAPAEGRPPEWNGAVGRFDLKATLDKTKANVDEPVTLRIALSGSGDLRSVSALGLPKLPDFKVYDPKIAENVDTSRGRMRSEKTFEYLLVPRAAGMQHIDPIRFAFFDPDARAYKTVATPAFDVDVARAAGGAAEEAVSVPAPVAQREPTVLGSDIRYLKPVPSGSLAPALPPWRTRPFGVLVVLPLICNAALLTALARRRHLEKNLPAVKARRAAGHAAKLIRHVALPKAGADHDAATREFHEGLHAGLLTFLSHKLDVPQAGLTAFRIDGMLEERGCADALREELRTWLSECDHARFTPEIVQGDEMKARRDRALALVKKLDRALPRNGAAKTVVKTAALLLCGVLLSSGARASDDTAGIWSQATQAYAERRYEESAKLWQSLLDGGARHPAVYYNLGNALFKAGRLGPSILAYRRALRSSPRDPDVLANLAFASERAVDEVARTPRAADAIDWVVATFGSRAASWLALALFVAGQLAIALVLTQGRVRRALLVTAIAANALAAVLGAYAGFVVLRDRGHVEAVVQAAKVEVRSGPGQDNAALFVVHEGLCVDVRDQQSGWVLVSLPNDLTGWVPRDAVEIV